jgi:hypothetical protein
MAFFLGIVLGIVIMICVDYYKSHKRIEMVMELC